MLYLLTGLKQCIKQYCILIYIGLLLNWPQNCLAIIIAWYGAKFYCNSQNMRDRALT